MTFPEQTSTFHSRILEKSCGVKGRWEGRKWKGQEVEVGLFVGTKEGRQVLKRLQVLNIEMLTHNEP